MKLEDATVALQKVEKALTNILLFTGKASAEHAERRYERYTRRSLVARYTKIIGGAAQKDNVMQAKVIDVSAGGMKMLVSHDHPLAVNTQLSFSIIKENSISILKGIGHVLRTLDNDDGQEVAIEFETVKR